MYYNVIDIPLWQRHSTAPLPHSVAARSDVARAAVHRPAPRGPRRPQRRGARGLPAGVRRPRLGPPRGAGRVLPEPPHPGVAGGGQAEGWRFVVRNTGRGHCWGRCLEAGRSYLDLAL